MPETWACPRLAEISAGTFADLVQAARLQQIHRVQAQGCLHGLSQFAQVRGALQAVGRPDSACSGGI